MIIVQDTEQDKIFFTPQNEKDFLFIGRISKKYSTAEVEFNLEEGISKFDFCSVSYDEIIKSIIE